MKIAVTGATGFVGRHLVRELLVRGHDITVLARNAERFNAMQWAGDTRFIPLDVHALSTQVVVDVVRDVGHIDALVHLAWPGLPNYRDLFHIDENLPDAYRIIRAFVDAGCPQVLVSGTCFEYGLREGSLRESMLTAPTNPYGVAKDSLRRHLEMLQKNKRFRLQWARLFYMYGCGQNSSSLLAQLDASIDRGETVFNMSGGEQLRDYLPVSQVASNLAMILQSPEFDGIVNVCSGTPISVRRLVENHLAQRGAAIDLNLGYYPYPDYEPFAFWGDNTILQSLEKS